VLDRDQLDHRQVEDLTCLHADHRRAGEVSATPVAVAGGVGTDLIRHRPRLQPKPLTALLLAGLTARGLPQ